MSPAKSNMPASPYAMISPMVTDAGGASSDWLSISLHSLSLMNAAARLAAMPAPA